MNRLVIEEDWSTGYKSRTIKNASADATIAIAVDFNTAGERLTKNSVKELGNLYMAIDARNLDVTSYRVMEIVRRLNSINKPIDSVASIPQNLVSGVESFGTIQEANSKIKQVLGPNPHSIDMIEYGFRTRTTRSIGEMSKYNIKVGDVVTQFGKSANGEVKKVITKVTAISYKGDPNYLGTWIKEGWTLDGVKSIERFKDGAASIEFELYSPSLTLNIAGNGIYTLKGRYTQSQIDNFTYELLKAVTDSKDLIHPIELIRSGGQTGFDEAGIKAAIRLGIPAKILAPKGFKFRDENGADRFDKVAFCERFREVLSNNLN